MDDRNKLIEKLGELSAKAYMFGRMYHIEEVTELTKDINWLIAKVFDYSPWHTGTPTEEGWYLTKVKVRDCDGSYFFMYEAVWFDDEEWVNRRHQQPVFAWQKIEED